MHIEFTNDVRLGGTAKKLEEVWVKIENDHGKMVWKGGKNIRKARGGKSERQIHGDLYVGIISCTNARWETSGVTAAAQKTTAN